MSRFVSYVIATYARPDALATTLCALVRQDHRDWEAIVVGDQCGPETAEAVRTIDDPRIRYYNLPERCGEQAGPNSFGMRLVRGDYLCFLNHDDLLFGDTVAWQLDMIHRTRADLLFSRHAILREDEAPADAALPPADRLSPLPRSARALYAPGADGLDPSSFWLVRTPFAHRVGPWRSARTLYRNPISDWLMRAWRLQPRVVFDDRVAGLWIRSPGADVMQVSPVPTYRRASRAFPLLGELLRSRSAAEVRALTLHPDAAVLEPSHPRGYALQVQAGALLCRLTGIDLFDLKSRLQGRRRGARVEHASMRRVGKPLGPGNVGRLLALDPESCRVL
jgi:hypothetical protein